MDNDIKKINNDLENNKKRLDWVDICRAIAIIFVFLGHWETQHITAFAYAFHLSLFFLVSGFFAVDCVKKYTAGKFIVKKVSTIILPLLIWAWVSTIVTHFDSQFSLTGIKEILKHPANTQSNYWFLPALFTVSITYYFLKKFLKKDFIILILSYILLICFGERGMVEFNIFKFLESAKITSLIGGYFLYGAIPTYLFWYSLGAFSFRKVSQIIMIKNEDNIKTFFFHLLGIIVTFCASILFLKNIVDIGNMKQYIYSNLFILNNYVIITTIIIMTSVIYISTFLEKSTGLKNIGKNTMAHMGLEYLTHNYITLSLLPMINLGIPNIQTSIHIITLTVLQFMLNNLIIKGINQYFPILNGKFDLNKIFVKIKKTTMAK